MQRGEATAAVSVERFFQFSLLGLVASGYLAVAGSGYLDLPTVMLTAAGLILRGLLIAGWVRLDITDRSSTVVALSYTGFYLVDYFVLSRDFLAATVHLVFFLAVIKILTAKSSRDHLYTAVIAFLELLAAALLSVNFNFFLFLALYLLFAIAALTSGELRRAIHRTKVNARGGFRRFHPRLALLSVSITAGILALTAGTFFILPRTAGAAFARLVPRRFHLPGFANQVTLGEIGEIKTNSRAVMHIRLYGDFPGGLKWRGGALIDFDGKRWTNTGPPLGRIPVYKGEAELRPAGDRPTGRRVGYQVEFEELETDVLFFAGTPESVGLSSGPLLHREGQVYQLGRTLGRTFHYSAYSLLEEPPETTNPLFPAPLLRLAPRERYLQLPQLDPRIAGQARTWTAGLTTDLERTRAIERRLRSDFGYTLELPKKEAGDPLAYFLFTRRKGHCEYFASAMTVMLRSLGIPARLATGFQSGVYNSLTDLWLVRASDAHTWVEAWMPGRGWTTFDPTPPDPNTQRLGLLSRLSLYLDAGETFWRQWVVGYDAGQQGSLADQLEQKARRLGVSWFDTLEGWQETWKEKASTIGRVGGRGAGVVVMLVALWLAGPRLLGMLRTRRRVRAARRGQANVADATVLYERMLQVLKRHGYQKPVWFTPAEFAASLPRGSLGMAVGEFTVAYNALRFGGRADVARRLSVLLDELERAGRA